MRVNGRSTAPDLRAEIQRFGFFKDRCHGRGVLRGWMSMTDELSRFVDNDRLARHLGIQMLEHANGSAKARMTIQDYHLNSAGTLHGGAIFALADAVFGAASNSHGTLSVAINVSISYFKAVRAGTVTAEAQEVSLNPKLGTYLVHVRDDTDSVIALFQGTVYRKKATVEEVLL
jgi:acyl-CoA thioesterase